MTLLQRLVGRGASPAINGPIELAPAANLSPGGLWNRAFNNPKFTGRRDFDCFVCFCRFCLSSEFRLWLINGSTAVAGA
jgi:hypothetical protein